MDDCIFVLLDGFILKRFVSKRARREHVFALQRQWEPRSDLDYKDVLTAEIFDTNDILPEIVNVKRYVIKSNIIESGSLLANSKDRITKEILEEWPRLVERRYRDRNEF